MRRPTPFDSLEVRARRYWVDGVKGWVKHPMKEWKDVWGL